LVNGTLCAQTQVSEQGWLKYGLGLSLMPQGEEQQLLDQSGQAYRLIHAAQWVDLSIHGSYRFSPQVTLHLELGSHHHLQQIRIENVAEPHTTAQLESAYQFSWWSNGRIVVQQKNPGRIRPQWSVTIGYPWVAKADVGFSLTGDPVVLTGALRYEAYPVEKIQSINVQCGMGLVANEKVSLMLSAQHSIPLNAMRAPKSVVLLGITYLWGQQNEREVGVHNVLESAGGQIHTGLRTQVHVKNKDLL
jgi:hypothetical protein